MALILPFEASSPRQLYVAVEQALRVDCAEAATIFDPINDLAAMIEAFNSGDTNRARALEFAEREGRRFDAERTAHANLHL